MTLKCHNRKVQIGPAVWRTVYILLPEQEYLFAGVNKGKLVNRKLGNSRRYSYSYIKKKLVKKQINFQEMPLPF